MDSRYDGILIMPEKYAEIGQEEKEITYGGIDYDWTMQTRVGAMAYASSYRAAMKWNNISTYDLGAEIFFHAYLYYHGVSAVLSILSHVGGKIGEAVGSIANSIGNGIDVKNGRDTKKEAGIERWVIYDAFYCSPFFS